MAASLVMWLRLTLHRRVENLPSPREIFAKRTAPLAAYRSEIDAFSIPQRWLVTTQNAPAECACSNPERRNSVRLNETTEALVTPRLIAITELAQQAEGGADVTSQLQKLVADAVEDFSHVYNGRSLLSALIHGLEAHGQDAKTERNVYAMVLLRAAAMADPVAHGKG